MRELEPGTPAIAVVGALHRRAEATVALVGHEPQLSRLASLLCTGDEHALTLDLKKGGAVLVDDGTLRWALPPKVLRGFADGRGGRTRDTRRLKGGAMKRFTEGEARTIGEQLGIDWESSPFDVEQFRSGMDIELEHSDVTGGEPLTTGKIALAHLHEFADYYTRLEAMEEQARLEHAV